MSLRLVAAFAALSTFSALSASADDKVVIYTLTPWSFASDAKLVQQLSVGGQN